MEGITVTAVGEPVARREGLATASALAFDPRAALHVGGHHARYVVRQSLHRWKSGSIAPARMESAWTDNAHVTVCHASSSSLITHGARSMLPARSSREGTSARSSHAKRGCYLRLRCN